jgi:hypothetical protein
MSYFLIDSMTTKIHVCNREGLYRPEKLEHTANKETQL